jgi:hypothetical protein
LFGHAYDCFKSIILNKQSTRLKKATALVFVARIQMEGSSLSNLFAVRNYKRLIQFSSSLNTTGTREESEFKSLLTHDLEKLEFRYGNLVEFEKRLTNHTKKLGIFPSEDIVLPYFEERL